MNGLSRVLRGAGCMTVAAAILGGCSSGSNSGFPPSGAVSSSGGSGIQFAGKQRFTHYYVIRLGTLGGGASSANSINDVGWLGGLAKISGNAAVHATLWLHAKKVDLGTLGGPNSAIGWPVKNVRGELAGFSDVAQTDPLAENFCALGSGNLCAGFTWSDNTLTALGTLGGNNSFASSVNNGGRVVGFAETSVQDSTCGAPQVLDYYGTVWNRQGKPRTLPPVSGDTVSQAFAINDEGATVGASGPCGPPNNVGYGTAHAVVWSRSGAPTALSTLGGTTANIATAINRSRYIVGQSALSGNTTYHAVAWQHGAVTDLGTLPGDSLSEALGLNAKDQVVGYSCDTSGNCRGFIWQNGSMVDLNVLAHSALDIVYAGDINDKGWIVGQAVDLKTGKAPAVLLIPTNGEAGVGKATTKVALPERVRAQLQRRQTLRFFIK